MSRDRHSEVIALIFRKRRNVRGEKLHLFFESSQDAEFHLMHPIGRLVELNCDIARLYVTKPEHLKRLPRQHFKIRAYAIEGGPADVAVKLDDPCRFIVDRFVD